MVNSAIKPSLIVAAIAIFCLFWVTAIYSFDPDYPWHLRNGQYILEQGIPELDPYSYSMPSFRYINHEWLTDISLYWLDSNFGQIIAGFIFAGIGLASLIFAIPKITVGYSALLLLSGLVVLPYFGIRPQILSWLFTSLLVNFLLIKRPWLTPVLFLIWANLHGSFVFGLIIVALFTLLSKQYFRNIIILILSSLLTLINPYGYRLWTDIWMQLSDYSYRFTIVEWMPILYRYDLAFIILVALSLLLIYKYRPSFKLFPLFLFSMLLFMSLNSQRYVPLWVVVTLPTIVQALQRLTKNLTDIPFALSRFNQVYKIITGVIIGLVLFQTGNFLWQQSRLTEDQYYPVQALQYLKQNPSSLNLFNPYQWGGYLIYELPERRVFIDGRMLSWRRQQSPTNESAYAYEEYLDFISGKTDTNEFTDKYQIDQILWFAPLENNQTASFGINSTNKNRFNDQLIENGWTVVYQDRLAVVYEKPVSAFIGRANIP